MRITLFIYILIINIKCFSQNSYDLNKFINSYGEKVSFEDLTASKKETNVIPVSRLIPDNIMEMVICDNKGFCLYKNDTIKVQYYYGLISDLSRKIFVITYREVNSFNNQHIHMITYHKKKKKVIDHILIKGFWEDEVFTHSRSSKKGCLSTYRAYMINKKESNVASFFWAKVFRSDYEINKKTGTIKKIDSNSRELLVKPLRRGNFEFYEEIAP